jgi:hypothetical protein
MNNFANKKTKYLAKFFNITIKMDFLHLKPFRSSLQQTVGKTKYPATINVQQI